MILKQLELENIRSYEVVESLAFDDGVSLFFGDVGAGKSSVLYAIEFALFGLSRDLTPGKLLRRGAEEGRVALTFQQDGQEYTVSRALRQTGSRIQHTDCTLTVNGDTKSYSVTDLKSEIIRILRFREKSSATASSVIYRYGVFTPQEEMKAILQDQPDERLETLRRAFRLDEYARVADNADNLRRYLKNTEVQVLRERARGLNDDREALEVKQETLEETRTQKNQMQGQIDDKSDMVGQLKAERQELEDKLAAVPSESELKALRNALESAQKESSNLEQELSELDQAQAELESEKQGLAEHSCPTDKSDEELSEAIVVLEGERDRLGEERGGIKQHISDHEALLDKGECPTCHRTIEEEDQEEFQDRLDELRQALESLEEQIDGVNERIDQLERVRSELSDYLDKQERIQEIDEELRSIQGKRTAKLEALQEAQAKVESQAGELANKEALAEENQDLHDELEKIETQIEELQEDIEHLREDRGRIEERETNLMSDVEELEGKIEEKEAAEAQAESYLDVVRYLKEYFIPTVQRIEQVMLQAIHDDFDRHFQRFFEITIGDTGLTAYIDEGFSPVITEDGYEVPFDDLSGGEKTSLALAYRLALNLTVKKLSKLDKTLLILDEPTDGFSREQVLNLREVLDAVGCDQTILVSHEEEVKGFADHGYKVEKIGRTSRITRL